MLIESGVNARAQTHVKNLLLTIVWHVLNELLLFPNEQIKWVIINFKINIRRLWNAFNSSDE